MKYYKKNEQGDYYEVTLDEAKKSISLEAPKETILGFRDTGGASFQQDIAEEIENPNYKDEMAVYEKNRVYIMPELQDLKEKAIEKIKNAETDRKTEVTALITQIQNATSINDLSTKMIDAHDAILKSTRGAPGNAFLKFFGFKGSDLGAAIRDFCSKNLYMTLSSSSLKENQHTTIEITDKDLYQLLNHQDKAPGQSFKPSPSHE